jgi:hypothetical protein
VSLSSLVGSLVTRVSLEGGKDGKADVGLYVFTGVDGDTVGEVGAIVTICTIGEVDGDRGDEEGSAEPGEKGGIAVVSIGDDVGCRGDAVGFVELGIVEGIVVPMFEELAGPSELRVAVGILIDGELL